MDEADSRLRRLQLIHWSLAPNHERRLMQSHSYPTERLFAGAVLVGLIAAQLINPLLAATPVVVAGVSHYAAIHRRRVRPRLMAPSAGLLWLFLAAGAALVLVHLLSPQAPGPRSIGLSPLAGFVAHLFYSWATYGLVQPAVVVRGGRWVAETASPLQFRIAVGLLGLLSLVFAVAAIVLAQPA